MFNSQILDVAIGLALMFLFQSILISGINDLLISLFSVRGKILKNFLVSALKTKDAKDTIFEKLNNTSFINSLKRSKNFPSEITAKNFSDGIIDLIIKEDTGKDNFITKLHHNINQLPDSDFKEVLIRRLQESDMSYERFKTSIESWYNEYMDNVSKWYKKRITYAIYLFSFLTTVALNVDAIFVMNELWKNPSLRESAVTMSENVIKKEYNEITQKKYNSLLTDSSNLKDTINVNLTKISDSYQNLYLLDFPITWAYTYHIQNKENVSIEERSLWFKICWAARQLSLEKIIGFIITTLAVSIGAPIWYDLIRKLVGARETIKKNQSS